MFFFILSFVQCICFLWKDLALERIMIEIPKLTEFDSDKTWEVWLIRAKERDQGWRAEGCCKDANRSWVTPKHVNCSEVTCPPLKFAHPDVGCGNLAKAKNTRGILDRFANRCLRGIRKAHVDRRKDLNRLGDKQVAREGRRERQQRPALLSVWGAKVARVR